MHLGNMSAKVCWDLLSSIPQEISNSIRCTSKQHEVDSRVCKLSFYVTGFAEFQPWSSKFSEFQRNFQFHSGSANFIVEIQGRIKSNSNLKVNFKENSNLNFKGI